MTVVCKWNVLIYSKFSDMEILTTSKMISSG